MNKSVIILTGLIAGALSNQAATTVFSTDFNGALPPEITGGTLEGVQGYTAVAGFSGNFLRHGNGDVTLSLNGLPAHTSVDVNFLFAAIDSWDGASGGSAGPDAFSVLIDGSTAFTANPDNITSADRVFPAGTAELAYAQPYGFWGSYPESAYDFSGVGALNVPHTASSLTVVFRGSGLQALDDESWALENLSVLVNEAVTPGAVPDGANTLILLSSALGALGILRRRI